MAADDSTTPELDDELLQELRDVAGQVDPEPDEVRAGALGALSWRTIDAELARLTSDTGPPGEPSIDGGAPGEVPAAAGGHRLTFEGGGLTVHVEVGADRVLVGRLLPGGTPEVEVCWKSGSTVVAVDGTGCFRAVGVPPGPVALRCRSRSDRAGMVTTGWIVL